MEWEFSIPFLWFLINVMSTKPVSWIQHEWAKILIHDNTLYNNITAHNIVQWSTEKEQNVADYFLPNIFFSYIQLYHWVQYNISNPTVSINICSKIHNFPISHLMWLITIGDISPLTWSTNGW